MRKVLCIIVLVLSSLIVFMVENAWLGRELIYVSAIGLVASILIILFSIVLMVLPDNDNGF